MNSPPAVTGTREAHLTHYLDQGQLEVNGLPALEQILQLCAVQDIIYIGPKPFDDVFLQFEFFLIKCN